MSLESWEAFWKSPQLLYFCISIIWNQEWIQNLHIPQFPFLLITFMTTTVISLCQNINFYFDSLSKTKTDKQRQILLFLTLCLYECFPFLKNLFSAGLFKFLFILKGWLKAVSSEVHPEKRSHSPTLLCHRHSLRTFLW